MYIKTEVKDKPILIDRKLGSEFAVSTNEVMERAHLLCFNLRVAHEITPAACFAKHRVSWVLREAGQCIGSVF